jgi:hypothetical protein
MAMDLTLPGAPDLNFPALNGTYTKCLNAPIASPACSKNRVFVRCFVPAWAHATTAVLTLADDADVWALLWPPLPHPASATSKAILHMKRDAFRINIPHDA